jgi:hypothetical protein
MIGLSGRAQPDASSSAGIEKISLTISLISIHGLSQLPELRHSAKQLS